MRAKMERNKKNVVEFYNAVLNEKNFDKAATYVGATYIQHNPIGADGLEGIKGFIGFLKAKFPNNKSEIKRVFADGNYVIVHVHAVRKPGTARQRDLRSVPARRQRQGAGALGRGAADPGTGKGAEQERDVLTELVDRRSRRLTIPTRCAAMAAGQARPFSLDCGSGRSRSDSEESSP